MYLFFRTTKDDENYDKRNYSGEPFFCQALHVYDHLANIYRGISSDADEDDGCLYA